MRNLIPENFKGIGKKKARNLRAKQQVEDNTSKNPGNM
jgi:hypothetical protein